MPRENRRRTRRNIREPLSRRETADPSTSGGNSPIQQRATSRAPPQRREPEEQMPRRSRRLQNMESTQRDRSRSPIDRSHQRPSPSDTQREEHLTCQICLQRLQQGVEIITTPCTHVFHSTCTYRWFMENDNCPVCQEVVQWNIEEYYEIPSCGTMTINAPCHIWRRKLSYSIQFNNGEPCIHGLPGQEYPIIGPLTSLWGRELEDQTGSSQRDRDQQREEQDTCSICFDDLHEEAETSRLPCSHRFHTSCITTWMQERTTCPLCRERITWNIKASFNVPDYGEITITAPGRFWSMTQKMQLQIYRGMPYLVLFPPST